jgi:hypothetical protein
MEEQKDRKGACECPWCSGTIHGHGCGHWHGFIILRVLLAIIVVVAAFWMGVKLGQLQSAYYNAGYNGGYGSHRMMRGYPMMGAYGTTGVVPQTTQAAPSTSATPTK